MKASRLFATDNSMVTICNGHDDGWVVFEDAAQFKRITGEDLPHNDYISYEPDHEMFHDDHYDPPSDEWAVLPFYENLINNAYVYLQRMQDPYYGMTPAEVAVLKLEDARMKLQHTVYTLIENKGREDLRKLKTMPPEAAQKMTEYAAQLEHYVSVLDRSLKTPVQASDEPMGEAADEPMINPIDSVVPVAEAIQMPEPAWPFESEFGDTSLWW